MVVSEEMNRFDEYRWMSASFGTNNCPDPCGLCWCLTGDGGASAEADGKQEHRSGLGLHQ